MGWRAWRQRPLSRVVCVCASRDFSGRPRVVCAATSVERNRYATEVGDAGRHVCAACPLRSLVSAPLLPYLRTRTSTAARRSAVGARAATVHRSAPRASRVFSHSEFSLFSSFSVESSACGCALRPDGRSVGRPRSRCESRESRERIPHTQAGPVCMCALRACRVGCVCHAEITRLARPRGNSAKTPVLLRRWGPPHTAVPHVHAMPRAFHCGARPGGNVRGARPPSRRRPCVDVAIPPPRSEDARKLPHLACQP